MHFFKIVFTKSILVLLMVIISFIFSFASNFNQINFEDNELKDLIIVFNQEGLAHTFLRNELSNEFSSEFSNEPEEFDIFNSRVEVSSQRNMPKSFEQKKQQAHSDISRFSLYTQDVVQVVENSQANIQDKTFVKNTAVNTQPSSYPNEDLNRRDNSSIFNFLNLISPSRNANEKSQNNDLSASREIGTLHQFQQDLSSPSSLEFRNLFFGMSLSNIDEQTYLEIRRNFPHFEIYEDFPVFLQVGEQTRNLLDIETINQMQIEGVNLTGEGITVAVVDTGIDPTHPDFGMCEGFTGEEVVSGFDSIPYELRTPHPYPNNFELIQNISLPDYVEEFQIFFKNYSIEFGFDFLEIFDSQGELVEVITGQGENYSSNIISGNTATLRFTSDFIINDYGYLITEMRVNLTTQLAQCPRIRFAYDFFNDNPFPYDLNGHGTHVASIIASNNSNPNLRGIAPGVRLDVYNVFSRTGGGSQSAILAAMDASLDPLGDLNFSNRADIISLSLGTIINNPNHIYAIKVDELSDFGVIPIVAAGNSGPSYFTIASPAASREAITVGATFKDSENWHSQSGEVDDVVVFSSRGPTNIGTIKPDIVAPGVNICAAKSSFVTSPSNACEGSSQHFENSGTSMATPIVSGVVALLLQQQNSLTTREVKSILQTTAINVGENELTQGRGRIDPLAAIELQEIPCQVNFDTTHLTTIIENNQDQRINASIICPNFQNYTLSVSSIDSNLNIQDTFEVQSGTTTSTLEFEINFEEITSDGYFFLTLQANDENELYSNYDRILIFNEVEGEAQVEGVINSCGDIFNSGIYTLDRNISLDVFSSDQQCIRVFSDDVTINCNGYSLEGFGSSRGIFFSGRSNVSINNCKFDMFNIGIEFSTSQNIEISNSTFKSIPRGVAPRFSEQITINNVTSLQNLNFALDIFRSQNILVSNSNFNNSIRVGHLSVLENLTIEDSTFENLDFFLTSLNNLDICQNINIINSFNFQGLEHLEIRDEQFEEITNRNLASLLICNSSNLELTNITINNSQLFIVDSQELDLRDIVYTSREDMPKEIIIYNVSNSAFESLAIDTDILVLINSINNQFNSILINNSHLEQSGPALALINSSNNSFNSIQAELPITPSLFSLAPIGIFLDNHNYNNTFSNAQFNNPYFGIAMVSKNNNNIFTNISITNSTYPVILVASNSNNTFNNIEMLNSSSGVFFESSFNNNNTFTQINFTSLDTYVVEIESNSNNSGNVFFRNKFEQPLFNVTQSFLQHNFFNTTINTTGIGNFWSGISCQEYIRQDIDFICTNPSEFEINSELGIFDFAPLIPRPTSITSINFENDSSIEVSNRGVELSVSFDNNISMIEVLISANNQTYSALRKDNLFTSSIQEVIPITYGVNEIEIFFIDENLITNKVIISNITFELSSSIEQNPSVIGNSSNIFTNIENLSILIGNSSNISQLFTSNERIRFNSNNSLPILEFENNFSTSILNTTPIQIRKRVVNNKSQLIASGFNLNENATKSFFLEFTGNLSRDFSLCIRDTNVEDFSQISQDCSLEHEMYIGSIPFENENYSAQIYNDSLSIIKISGLRNSGASQVCTENWQYSEFGTCTGLK